MAAINTATFGDKTLVDTDVAIAFAVSWKPFIKSKMTARTITQISKKNVSCIFEDYCFEYIGDILTLVRCILEVLIYLFPFYDQDGVFNFFE